MPSASCDVLLDDIEDIISQEDSKPQDRHFSRKHVFPKVRRRNTQKYLQEEPSPPSDSTIPGIQKIWIRTWGCSHNNSDGEYMAGQLAAYGYKITAQCGKSQAWASWKSFTVVFCFSGAHCPSPRQLQGLKALF
ncbi:CDK5 regulatory subunit associated protein 1-like 1 (predicted), isoform CRA_a [Rattus norvegicus]|uniref:CDK5 regulatory subunit associated protein 1-like 1 (Predicted), isoform CRA_a n=1 Tax=Rattus norvegicus TaxID=10116 RepID=A6J7N7_RAT|nr:CDK5 regulatory subunit associated protein 1-like 1 (predicted), isoform CRA_a [Rattus norvegicus]